MNAPRATTPVHPVTDVGSFLAFGDWREMGLLGGGVGCFWIEGGAGYRDGVLVCGSGDGVGRMAFYDFRACEGFVRMYWGIHPFQSSCARTFLLVPRAVHRGARAVYGVSRMAYKVRRVPQKVAGLSARCAGSLSRPTVQSSRCTARMARRAVGVKIRTVRAIRRTGRVVRWSFPAEIWHKLGKMRPCSAVGCEERAPHRIRSGILRKSRVWFCKDASLASRRTGAACEGGVALTLATALQGASRSALFSLNH